MFIQKLWSFSYAKKIIFRISQDKRENNPTSRELWKFILSKTIQIMIFRIRRLRIILQPNYDFFGWKMRSREQAEEDLYHESANRKSLYLHTQIDFNQISTFLEIGRNSGIHIFDLARKYPKCKFVGVDVNFNAVSFANDLAKKTSLSNLAFYQANLQEGDSLDEYKKLQWDVIFSWGTLINIHPTRILPIIDFGVKSSKIFFLIEQHKRMRFAVKGRLMRGQPTWIRDYAKIVKKFNDKSKQIIVSPVPSEIWNPGGGHATQIIVGNL